MSNRVRCKGTNTRGQPCGNWVESGTEFCIWHEQSEEDRALIVRLLLRAKGDLPAFIAGALGEAVVGDFYDVIKGLLYPPSPEEEEWGIWSTINKPPFDLIVAHPAVARVRRYYMEYKHRTELAKLASFLQLGLEARQVIQLIGRWSSITGGVDRGPSVLPYPPLKGHFVLHYYCKEGETSGVLNLDFFNNRLREVSWERYDFELQADGIYTWLHQVMSTLEK